MIIPIRCFSCNKVVGNKYNAYLRKLETMTSKEALTSLGLRRYCCRRMIVNHVELCDKILDYEASKPKVYDTSQILLGRGTKRAFCIAR